jgi:hypothetical protein
MYMFSPFEFDRQIMAQARQLLNGVMDGEKGKALRQAAESLESLAEEYEFMEGRHKEFIEEDGPPEVGG